jgi:hypothetical protein
VDSSNHDRASIDSRTLRGRLKGERVGPRLDRAAVLLRERSAGFFARQKAFSVVIGRLSYGNGHRLGPF